MPAGRPSRFTKAEAKEICRRLSDGETLVSICNDERMPNRSTVMDWYISGLEDDAKPEFAQFSAMYERAREAQAEVLADEIISIADDGSQDYVEIEDGKGGKIERVDHEHINRSRLRVDSRKWAASKLYRRRYGDSVALTGHDSGPLVLDDTRRSAEIAALLDAARAREAGQATEGGSDLDTAEGSTE